ncbi:MAG: SRPBCC family protein [Acidimicrobiia bacterium]
MKIEDEFRVDVPVDAAWKVLLDVERIAPCMPGAQLQEVEGEEFRGIVKVKVGPITAQYKGVAKIIEADEAARRIVIQAEGRDTRGQGTASANVTATLTSDGAGTVVHIDTDLNVTGKVAQFGRGVMADVSSKLLGQFADCLEHDLLSGNGESGAAGTPDETAPAPSSAPVASESAATTTGPRKIDSPEAQPVDLLDSAGGAVAKRVVPIVIVVVALLLLRSLRKRRKRKQHEKAPKHS